LDDLVFPAEIVGKRIRVKLDGKQVMKVHLDKTQQTNIEHKVFFNFCNKIHQIYSNLYKINKPILYAFNRKLLLLYYCCLNFIVPLQN